MAEERQRDERVHHQRRQLTRRPRVTGETASILNELSAGQLINRPTVAAGRAPIHISNHHLINSSSVLFQPHSFSDDISVLIYTKRRVQKAEGKMRWSTGAERKGRI